MEELEFILRAHAARYPAMEPTDAVKLIYQNEFGGGHLIPDPERAISYLRQEYRSTARDFTHPRAEAIGNGIFRIHLEPLSEEEVNALGAWFLRSAAEHRGTIDGFLQKLKILRCLTEQGCFAFSLEDLEHYLKAYAQKSYPPVSHSSYYREQYHPAYRIVLGKYVPAEWL